MTAWLKSIAAERQGGRRALNGRILLARRDVPQGEGGGASGIVFRLRESPTAI